MDMDRKFRFGLVLKEFCRLWYVLVALVLVCMAVGAMYSAFISKAEYTAKAAVSIQMTTADTSEGAMDRLYNVKSNLKTDVISADLYNEINEKIDELSDGKKLKAADYAKIYKTNADRDNYSIEIKMNDEQDATELAEFFITRVMERVNAARVTEEYVGYNVIPTEAIAPTIVNEEEPTPIWMTMIIGAVLGVVIHAVVSIVVFYCNKKIYDAEEFRDTFIIPLLEENFEVNGFSGAAIMLSRKRTEGVPFVVAVGDGFDIEKVAGGFASLGCRIAVGGVDEIAAGADVRLDGEVVSRVVVNDGAGKLVDIKNAVEAFKEKFSGTIDILVAVASPVDVRKDLYILSDAADATVVRIDLSKMTKMEVAEFLENLKSADENKYVAAVI